MKTKIKQNEITKELEMFSTKNKEKTYKQVLKAISTGRRTSQSICSYLNGGKESGKYKIVAIREAIKELRKVGLIEVSIFNGKLREALSDEEITKQAREYLTGGYLTAKTADGMKKSVENIPTKSGLAVYLGSSKETFISKVSRKDKEGDYIYPMLREIVDYMATVNETDLINGGLDGCFNSKITQLMLSSEHNINEKKEETHKHEFSLLNAFEQVNQSEILIETSE